MRPSQASRLVSSLFLATLLGCAKTQEQAPPAVDRAAISAQIDSLNKAFVAAVAARDTDAVVALYADDARVLPAGMARADGHDAIRATWVEVLRTPGLVLTFSGNDPIISEAGDMVIDLGTYDMKVTGAKGKPIEDVGKYVDVLKRVDGGWKIIVDTFNSDKAPAGM